LNYFGFFGEAGKQRVKTHGGNLKVLYFILMHATFERMNVFNGQGNKEQLRSWCFGEKYLPNSK